MASIGTVLSVFILLLVGYGAKKLHLLKAGNADVLNTIVVYFTLPAFIFNAIYTYKQPLPLSLAKVPIIGFVMIMVVVGLAYVLGRCMKLSNAVMAGFILATAFGNTGFIGYPVVQAAFADKAALVTAVLYDEIAMALPLYVVGLFVIALFAGRKTGHSEAMRVFLFPQLWAIPLALALRQFQLPTPLTNAIHYLANGTVPLVMISLGLSLSAKSLKGYALPVAVVCALKLAVLPLITYYAARLGGIRGVALQSTVLESAMPTAMMVGVLVSKFGENGELIAGMIFIVTLLSIITIPASILILGIQGI